jgi:Na+/H+-dicarboxylate symporter
MTERAGPSSFPEIRVPAGLTFAGLVLGFAAGILLRGTDGLAPLLAIAEPAGALWLRALQLTILPLVIGLVFTGISQTLAAAGGSSLARRAVMTFVIVLLGAAAMAALLVPALLALAPIPARAAAALSGGAADPGQVPGLAEILSAMMPRNIFAAAAEGAMLPVVVFAALFALAARRIAEAPQQQLVLFFEGLAAAMMVIVGWVLMLAPVGVFGLALALAAKTGTDAIGGLAHYIVVVSAAGAVVLAAAYGLALTAGRQRPAAFARALLPVQAVALSTQSSLACLPAMLAASRRLGVREATADFVLPLAVAIFRATSPAMNLAVAIYVAKLTGVDLTAAVIAAGFAVALVTTAGTTLSPTALAAGVLVAFLVSLSSVSLPGTLSFVVSVGPIAMAMGVPIAPLALLVAVEVLPDIMRTLGNATMDVAVTATVDRRTRD